MADFRYSEQDHSWLVTFVTSVCLLLFLVAFSTATVYGFDPDPSGPDVELVQSADSDPVLPSADVVYTLRYKNVGDVDATNVIITEIVPDHMIANLQSSAITSGWDCQSGGQAGSTCTLALADANVTIGNGGEVTFVATVMDAPIPVGAELITNTAQIAFDSSLGDDPTPANNHASVTIALDAAPDLAVEKSDGGITAKPGEIVTYTLTVVNNGTQTAAGVEVNEVVPLYTSYVGDNWNCPTGNTAGEQCTVQISALEPDAPQQLPFVVQVDEAVPFAVTALENSVTVHDDGQGGNDPTDDNSITILTPIDVLPILTMTKEDGDLVVIPGEVITYTLTITNIGAQAAPNVVISETVPAATRFVGSAGDWSCLPDNEAGLLCTHTVTTLAVNQPINVQFRVQVLDPLPEGVTQIENTALLCGGDLPDTVEATAITPLTTPPDLHLNKSASPDKAAPGDVIFYTLAYANHGGRPAPNSLITEMVPEHTQFRPDESTVGWLCTPNHNAQSTCTLDLNTINAGATDSVVFAVQVISSLQSGITQIHNQATISHDGSQGSDPTPNNNQSKVNTTVEAAPDLTLTKSDGGVTATAGQTVVYELAYQNVGNQAATQVVLTETVPAQSSFNASESHPTWVCPAGGGAGAQCTLALGTLASNEQGSVNFAVDVASLLPAVLTPLTNHARIGNDGANGVDPTPGNNQTSDNTPLKAAPNLRIKTDDQGQQAKPGDPITYRLTYTNAGTQAAQGVLISTTVPAHTVFVGPTDRWDCAVNAPAGTICTFAPGVLLAQSQGMLNFVVQVANPLVADVEEVRHVVQIGSSAEPYAYEDQAITPINAAPELRLRKSDGGATVEPDKTVVYVLSYENRGDQAATGVLLREEIPSHTTFVAELSSPGWVCAQDVCTYSVGDLAGGESGQVEFAVKIAATLRAVVTTVDNQAHILDDQRNGVDPLPANNTATDSTEVALALALDAIMQARLVEDADLNNTVSPGDMLEYVVVIFNRGNRELTGVAFADTLDTHTHMASANSVQSSQGSVQSGNNPQDRNIQVRAGSLQASQQVTITWKVMINKPLPANATLIEQQGIVTSNEAPTVTTDDPAVAGANDRTKTSVTLEPLLRITKLDFHFTDADNDDKVSSGDKILYSIKVLNTGNAATSAVVLSDIPDANTTLVVGKVQSSRGAILSGNRSGDTEIKIDIGELAAGESAEISLLVTVKPTLTSSQLINQATATYSKAEQTVAAVSDDPATVQAQDATLTPVNRKIEDVVLRLYLPLVRRGQ